MTKFNKNSIFLLTVQKIRVFEFLHLQLSNFNNINLYIPSLFSIFSVCNAIRHSFFNTFFSCKFNLLNSKKYIIFFIKN